MYKMSLALDITNGGWYAIKPNQINQVFIVGHELTKLKDFIRHEIEAIPEAMTRRVLQNLVMLRSV